MYHQSGDYEKAIDQYTILRDQEPDEVNPTILRNLGDCYTKMDALEAAAICYFLAYNANREHAGLADVLINTMLRIGGNSVKDALAICDTALYYNPDNRQLKRDKGMALYMLKDYQQADTLYAGLLAEGDSSFLESMYEDAFFRNVAELSMLTPDGKKLKLSVIDLRTLINRLPEMTAEEKEAYDKQMKEMKKVEAKKQQERK